MADTVAVSAGDVRVVSSVLTVAASTFGSRMGQIPGFGAALEACGRMCMAAADAGMPESPISVPAQVAIAHNEMMRVYMDAEFTREEAYGVLLTYISANAQASALRSARG